MKNIYCIEEFGAVGDGSTVNTSALQNAIDACSSGGGGRVLCGAGNFVTGTLTLKSGVDLHLMSGSRIVGSRSLKDYLAFDFEGYNVALDPENSGTCLIRAFEADNIAITGPGTIDGSGDAFYDVSKIRDANTHDYALPDTPRPRLVMLYRCRNVRLEDSSFVRPACWTIWLMRCQRVNVRGIRCIQQDRGLRNSDGIDVDGCSDVLISDSFFQTGDDCIVLRNINPSYDSPGVCENVVISNCTLESGANGVRIGCPSDGVVRNCLLGNLVIKSRKNGVNCEFPQRYMQTGHGATASVHDIQFSNIRIECGMFPVRIFVEPGFHFPRISDISFSHVRIAAPKPCTLHGTRETPIANFSFDNVAFSGAEGEWLSFKNCVNMRMNNVTLGS